MTRFIFSLIVLLTSCTNKIKDQPVMSGSIIPEFIEKEVKVSDSTIQYNIEPTPLVLSEQEEVYIVIDETYSYPDIEKRTYSIHYPKYSIIIVNEQQYIEKENTTNNLSKACSKYLYARMALNGIDYGYIQEKSIQKLEVKSIEEALEYALTLDNGVENIWGLADGNYHLQQIKLQSPQFQTLRYSEKTIAVRNSKVHLYSPENYLVDEKFGWATRSKLGTLPESLIDQKNIPVDTDCYIGVSDWSGGGERYTFLVYDGKLMYIESANSTAFFEQVSYVFDKGKTGYSIDYDLSFPWYALITLCDAYSTDNIFGVSDVIITGNQREGEYYSLSKEGVESIVEISGISKIKGENVIIGTYKKKKIWIKQSSIPERSIYRSIEAIHDKVGYEYGL